MGVPFQVVTPSDGTPRPRFNGGAGLSIYGGQVDDWLDNNSKTRGRAWYGEQGAPGWGHQMLNDPHVRRARDALVDPVVGATWDFEPASDDPLAREIADFCRFAFFECMAWESFLGLAMRAYVRDGFSIFEVTDANRPVPQDRFSAHQGAGQGVVPTGFHYRPAYSLEEWLQGRRNPTQLAGVRQYLPGSDKEQAGLRTIRSGRFVRFTWEQEGANFPGFPILRSAWGPWFAKRLLMRIEVMSHEKNHLALPFVTLPDGTDGNTADEEIDKLATSISKFRAHENGYYILPGGYGVDFKSGGANTPIQTTIDRLNFDIAHNVSAAFMLLGAKTTGSYNVATTQQGQFDIGLNKHAAFVANVLNNGADGWSPVERIVSLNYGDNAPRPRLIARNMPTVDWMKVLPELTSAVEADIIQRDQPLADFYRRVTQAPAADPTTRRKAPAPAEKVPA